MSARARALPSAAALAGGGLLVALLVGAGRLAYATDRAPDAAQVAQQAQVVMALAVGLAAACAVAVAVFAGLAREAERERRRLAAELSRMTRAAAHAERLGTLGMRTAGIVHDLRSPLGAAVMGCELLSEPDGMTPEMQARVVGSLDRALRRTLAQVDQLLDFARTDAACGGADPALAARTASRLVPIDDCRRVQVAIEPNDRQVALGEQALVQVLTNLMGNALQAGQQVEVSAQWAAEGAELLVDDDGPGVPCALREQIFAPFFTTKPAGEGTGLGLALCRAMVEEAGGQLRVDESPLGGARFVVSLPWAAADRPLAMAV
jgi:two-component system NtrC family sensor kinase